MRRFLTFLTALVLVLGSLAIGLLAADLPFWRRAAQLPLAADESYLPVIATGPGTPPAAGALPVSTAQQSDTAALEYAVRQARNAGSRVLLVMRKGEPVLARYFGADDERSLVPAGLVARPVVAMAVGLAIADGRLGPLDTPVSRYLPEWDGEPRGSITLRQLLEDTSGLETGGDVRGLLHRSPWDDLAHLPAFATSKGVRMLLGNDFASTALRFELEHEPGGFFNLSPANAQLAALIIERATGVPYEDFVGERIFAAAGAGPAELPVDRRAGMPAAHCCWRTTAPGVARLVSLLATDGEHSGRRILPQGWVAEMARASRVNAGSGMQLQRVDVEGLTALAGEDDNGSRFWVFPEYQIAIVNLVNPSGSSPAELPGLLLRALPPG
ncbi:MAG TPA: serine hydrolase [Steroidobacteraceae bacterium]|jgi:CubicO group peptidase (beta-lactamase class C family)|nr:serine hydrolase [Steroidobacteraceae bacterium]